MIIADDLNGARTERIADSLFDLMKGTKRSHSGVRLFDELMVDIMGALIPGVLFNFSLIICFVLPIIIYKISSSQPNEIAEFMNDSHTLVFTGSSTSLGGWFWFAAFLTFLILSYIAGHVFFRSDINKTDREDIRRRIKQNTKDVICLFPNKKNKIDEKRVKDMVQSELDLIKKDIKTIPGLCDSFSEEKIIKSLCKSKKKKDPCVEISNEKDLRLLLENINSIINSFESQQLALQGQQRVQPNLYELVLPILFPHKEKPGNKNNQNPWSKNIYLIETENKIFEFYFKEAKYIIRVLSCNRFFKAYYKTIHKFSYLKWFHKTKKKYCKTLTKADFDGNCVASLLACFLILRIQNDSGCSHWDFQSDYPYNDYYKYLMKRNELGLIRYVDWSQAGARTKNKVNRMKIDVQLDYPDAYAIINKNESHIRMASSSWYVARFVKIMAIICAAVLFVFAIMGHFDNETKELISSFVYIPEKIIVLAILPPSLLAFLLYFLQHQIIKFIHYQRLREIYFTLYIYHKLKTKSCEQFHLSNPKGNCILQSVKRLFSMS